MFGFLTGKSSDPSPPSGSGTVGENRDDGTKKGVTTEGRGGKSRVLDSPTIIVVLFFYINDVPTLMA